MIYITCQEEHSRPIQTRLYSLHEAASLITANAWGVQVDGIHSESLRRACRNKKIGRVFGREVFLSNQDLLDLGYRTSVTDENLLALDIEVQAS